MNKGDVAALERLRVLAVAHREAVDELARTRTRRDFLIVAAYRRGISIRVIADAAGVHFTRVAQLVADARRVADESGMKPIRPRKRKNHRRDA